MPNSAPWNNTYYCRPNFCLCLDFKVKQPSNISYHISLYFLALFIAFAYNAKGWQKLFANFFLITVLGMCNQDRTY